MTSSVCPICDPAWVLELSPTDGKWFGAFACGLIGDNAVGAPKYRIRVNTKLHETLEACNDELTVLTAGIPEAQASLGDE